MMASLVSVGLLLAPTTNAAEEWENPEYNLNLTDGDQYLQLRPGMDQFDSDYHFEYYNKFNKNPNWQYGLIYQKRGNGTLRWNQFIYTSPKVGNVWQWWVQPKITFIDGGSAGPTPGSAGLHLRLANKLTIWEDRLYLSSFYEPRWQYKGGEDVYIGHKSRMTFDIPVGNKSTLHVGALAYGAKGDFDKIVEYTVMWTVKF